MRNFTLTSDTRSLVEPEAVDFVRHLTSNSETGEVYYVKGQSLICCHGQEDWQVALYADLGEAADSRVTSLTFSLELEALCITTSAGHVFLLGIDSRLVEEVGWIEGGVITADWSPDGEQLVVISRNAQILLFNKAFDVLAEASAFERPERVVPTRQLPAPEPSSDVVTAAISWRGDGKYFATVTLAASERSGVLRVWEREGGSLHTLGEETPGLLGPVCWQPNGRHIYAAQQLEGQVIVAVFERNGLRHGSFVVAQGSGAIQQLAWSSDSEMLAVVMHVPGICQGVQIWSRSNWHWYLKQELRHLEEGPLQVQWNDEGAPVLTICSSGGELRKIEIATTTAISALGTAAVVDGSKLLLTPLRHSVVPPPLCSVTASFSAPIQCLAFLDGGPFEVVATALADGGLALLKSVEEDAWEETLEEELESESAGLESGISHDSCPSLTATPLSVHPSLPKSCHVRCLAWADANMILAAASALEDGQMRSRDVLLEIEVSGHLDAFDAQLSASAQLIGTTRLDTAVLQLTSAAGGALVQLQSGSILKYAAGSLTEVEGFPLPCPFMCPTPASSLPESAPPAAGLAADGQLFFGQTLVASNVTSMTVHCGSPPNLDYLLYTTKDNFLHTRPLADLAHGVEDDNLTAQPTANGSRRRKAIGEGKYENHYTAMHAAMRGQGASVPSRDILKARAVEQGSMIVAAPPHGTAVVLQMPRGNLETVHPRSLVLPAAALMIEAGQWEEAWQTATVHRLDLNLLVDHCWPSFLREAAEFLRKVPDDQDIVDLLSALKEQSITAKGGLYAGLPEGCPSQQVETQPSGAGKISMVCEALRSAMLTAGPEQYLKPILTSFVAQGHLQDALQLLKDTKEAQMAREASNSLASTSAEEGEARMGQGALGLHRRNQTKELPTAEDALNHLLLTVEVEHLYRAALGMYELELAYMVVAHSQRDPGEYLMELQQLAANPPGPLRKFAINLHLNQTSEAIRNLLEAGADHFDRALALARKEGKLRELLSLLENEDQSKRKRALQEYGQWLSERQLREDAAVSFLAAGDLASALTEYKEGNHWQMALATAGRLGFNPEELRELAGTLVESLSESACLSEAARVAAEHLRDGDTAVSLFSQAREWREAVRHAALFDRQDLVETTVAPAAAEVAASLLEEFEENKEKVQKYSARLKEVRARKAALSAALQEADDVETGDFNDTASEGGVSSIVSGLSAYTQASVGGTSITASSGRAPSTLGGRWPQRKRKKAKKGPKIRQGSPEEEAALVGHIAALAPSNKQCVEVGQLAELLIFLGHELDAKKLQTVFSILVADQKAADEDARADGEAAPKERESLLIEHKRAAPLSGPHVPHVEWKWEILRA